MLTGKTTKNKMGITLMGDIHDLGSLEASIRHIMHAVNAPGKETGFILSLAEDVQKAVEGRGIVFKEEGFLNYFGVNILWISWLFRVKYLRHAAGYVPTDERVQSDLYRMEHLTLDAVRNEDAAAFSRMQEWLCRPLALTADFLFDYVAHLDYTLYKHASGPEDRLSKLPLAAADLDIYSRAYRRYKENVIDFAAKNKVGIDEVAQDYDFPDEREW